MRGGWQGCGEREGALVENSWQGGPRTTCRSSEAEAKTSDVRTENDGPWLTVSMLGNWHDLFVLVFSL